MQAIASLERYTEKDLHYSGAITVSVKDLAQIRAIMVQTIENIRAVVKPSKDEVCAIYCLDLFKLGK